MQDVVDLDTGKAVASSADDANEAPTERVPLLAKST
jgi:hypothetical protein